MTANRRIVALDLDAVPDWLRLDIETFAYTGFLSGSDLRHLAFCADERERHNAEKLSRLLGGET